LKSADRDLHSGMWGGRVPNPNNELVKVLAQLWDEDRRVTIPGFYDDVVERSAEERATLNSVDPGYAEHMRKLGLDPAEADVGEAGYTNLEREWIRPTCDINGIFGGYTGEGAKTVIPAWAGAKISFRLVADQDPAAISAAFRRWLDERTPAGCAWEFHDHGGGHAGAVDLDSPYLAAARTALRDVSAVEPALVGSGGSIPVVGLLKQTLGLDTLLIGFGLDDDRVHSPNEKFELDCFRMGMRTHAALVDRFMRLG
jgi:acetylornithine deacetylase/succinyl-diaminopimelate desuccinylase-like protein